MGEATARDFSHPLSFPLGPGGFIPTEEWHRAQAEADKKNEGFVIGHALNTAIGEGAYAQNASTAVGEGAKADGTNGVAVGKGLVALTMLSEAALLFVAAQAGFIDGPRVLANMAVDSWLPQEACTAIYQCGMDAVVKPAEAELVRIMLDDACASLFARVGLELRQPFSEQLMPVVSEANPGDAPAA